MNYLLGQEECDEDLLEIITVYKSLKDPKIKGIALEQMKLLATIHPAVSYTHLTLPTICSV